MSEMALDVELRYVWVSVTRLRMESDVFAESTRRRGVVGAFGSNICGIFKGTDFKKEAAESSITC